MSRRSTVHRVSSALFGAWFALFSVVPSAWRPCPMHAAGHSAGHAASAGDAAETQCEHGHEAHAGSSSTPARSHTPAPEHRCDCATNCCSVPVVAPVEHPARFEAAPLRFVKTSTAEPAPRHAPSRERLLPFANGPPAVIAG